MADDTHRRTFRQADRVNETSRVSTSGNDPLAELARLIGQTDPFAEYGQTHRPAAQPAEAPVMDWTARPRPAQTPAQPQAPNYRAPTHYPTPAEMASQMSPYATQPNYAADHAPPYPHATDAYVAAPAMAEPAAPAYESYDAAYGAGGAVDDGYDDIPPPRRRFSVLAMAGVFALVVVGAASAFGYRALFGSSGSSPPPVIAADGTPSKVVPASAAGQGKLISDRVGASQGEKIVSREEQPLDVKARAALASPVPAQPDAQNTPPPLTAGPPAGEPKKIKTIAIKPDQIGAMVEDAQPPAVPPPRQAAAAARNWPEQTQAAPQPSRPATVANAAPPARASGNAPLSLSPAAPAQSPTRTAAAAPVASASSGGGYAVQVTSQRSEAEARSAFAAMQSRYPAQLGGRTASIRRADLGSKGVYYRAMVGPFANGGDAKEVCDGLKSAGASCIIQRN